MNNFCLFVSLVFYSLNQPDLFAKITFSPAYLKSLRTILLITNMKTIKQMRVKMP